MGAFLRLCELRDEVPNTLNTKFRIGSVTKQFTAMAVMILQEHGKLALTDSICKYVKRFPAIWYTGTIRTLLIHR